MIIFIFIFLSFYIIIVSIDEGNVQTIEGSHGSVNPMQESEFRKTGKLSLLKGQSSYSPLGGGGIIKDDDDIEGVNL